MCVHRLATEYHGQVLVVDGVLPQSRYQPPRLLEESLALPVRIDLMENLFDTIVFTHPDDMLSGDSGEFVHTTVTCDTHTHTRDEQE